MWEQVIKVMQEMIHDRGYTSMTHPAEDVYLCQRGEADRLLIFICKSEKFNIESIKYFIFLLQDHRLKHGIIIYNNIITSSASKAIDHLQDYTIEMFEKKELQFNATKHRLFCPHVCIPKDKVKEELPTINIQNLPIILRNDMIVRYYHFARGDIIRIQRMNGSIAYRLVK